MGERQRATRSKLALHAAKQGVETPRCIFCFGAAPASELDHVPPKIAFPRKSWPEGFEFPSCEACNKGTRRLDLLVALLAAFGGDEGEEASIAERQEHLTALVRKVEATHPGLPARLVARPIDVKRYLRIQGISLSLGQSTREVPLLRITEPQVRSALDAFAWKITCALHYEKLGRILRSKVGLEIRWLSGAFPDHGMHLDQVLELLKQPPVPRRSGKSLSPYFDYAFNCDEAGRWAVFAVKLGAGLSLVAFVDPDGLLSQGGETDRYQT